MGRIRQIVKKMFMAAFHRFPPLTDRNFRLENSGKILFVLAGKRIGDTVVFSFFPREFKRFFPDKELVLAVEEKYSCLLEKNGYARTVPIPGSFIGWLKLLRHEKFDTIIELPGGADHHRQLAYYFSGAKAVILEKTEEYNYPYARYFKVDLKRHITEAFKGVLRLFGSINEEIDISYQINVSLPEKQYKGLFADSDRPLVVFNPHGNITANCLSKEKTRKIIDILLRETNFNILLLDYKKKFDFDDHSRLVSEGGDGIAILFNAVRQADYVLTVDTGSVHIAEMYSKPMTAICKKIIPPGLEKNLKHPCSNEKKEICISCSLCQWHPVKKADIIIGQNNADSLSAEEICGSVINNFVIY